MRWTSERPESSSPSPVSRRRKRLNRASRGVALLLVMIAVVVSSTIAYSFLAGQGTSTRLAANMRNQAAAQLVAESGLDLALAYLRNTSDWRSQKTSGVWVDQQPVAGGSCTIEANLPVDTTLPFTITSTAWLNGTSQAIEARLTPKPADSPGISANGLVSIAGSAFIDSFNSLSGFYGGSNIASAASVSTNSTAANQIYVNGGALRGNAWCGPNGNPGTVIKTIGGGVITGTRDKLTEAIAMPSMAVSGTLTPSLGSFNVSYGGTYYVPYTFDDDMQSYVFRFNNLTLRSTTRIRVTQTLSILCDGNFEMRDTAALEIVGPNTVFTIYAKGAIRFYNSSFANLTGKPHQLVLKSLNTGSLPIEITSSAQVCAKVEAAQTDLRLRESGDLYGTFVGRGLYIQDTAAVHQDTKDTGQGGPAQYSVDWIN